LIHDGDKQNSRWRAGSIMLNEQKIREAEASARRVMLSVMLCAAGCMLLYLLVLIQFRDAILAVADSRLGDAARPVVMFVLIALVVPLFLAPLMMAAQYATRFRVECPLCGADVLSCAARVLATRACPSCNQRIVEGGRAHSSTVYERYRRIASASFLRVWLWAWPAIGAGAIAMQLLDPSAWRQCPAVLWHSPVFGTCLSGYAWIRTWDRRYLPPFLVSLCLVVPGALLYWRA
jgi:hypothetical protein